MKTLPKKIKVTFQKSDQMNAEKYENNKDCLLATALKRMGYNHTREIDVHAMGHTMIGESSYRTEGFDVTWANYERLKPFYPESVVGKTITLTKEEVCAK